MKAEGTIRTARRKLSPPKTIQEFATSAGISYQHLSNIETGKTMPSQKMVHKIAVALSIDYADLWEQVVREWSEAQSGGSITSQDASESSPPADLDR